ncbi:hypothetical protein [Dendronalium sp. ChiSLP03b]|uniref:hypothetical protein n=1 Tax=Dendronalium sp. ChiSLP03b TaxID=3075381 RepID=UPI002AD56057|nr:hypothetical protein [Dendronalium sp. ChiSLP03b]MDZ8209417.1 hypothetical protein [Dendronalium sp. ChiSLP03b]
MLIVVCIYAEKRIHIHVIEAIAYLWLGRAIAFLGFRVDGMRGLPPQPFLHF